MIARQMVQTPLSPQTLYGESIAPQVVFEILSPGGTHREIAKKQCFCQEHGVLEMYFYEPESQEFWGFWRRQPTDDCILVTGFNLPWVSPLLKIQFKVFEDGLAVFYPDGSPFKDFDELASDLSQVQVERDRAQNERDAAFAKLRELGVDPSTL